MLWAGSYLLLGALCAVKISCLQFYAQMFVTKRFVMAVNIMNVVLVAWFIVHVFVSLSTLKPIALLGPREVLINLIVLSLLPRPSINTLVR